MLPASRENKIDTSIDLRFSHASLSSTPVYDETGNLHLANIIHDVIVNNNVHDTASICERVRSSGLPVSPYVILSKLESNNAYVRIQEDFWESRFKLVSEVHDFILDHIDEFNIKTTRAMPEMELVIKPSSVLKRLPRYNCFDLRPEAFGEAAVECIQSIPNCELIVTNGVIVNFREAFVKDLYNVLLRERAPLGSLDIALRLFDSKVGIYKKSLKDFVSGRRNKDQEKVIHHRLHANEIWRLSRLIEHTIEFETKHRPEIFIRLPDGKIDAYRNHTGILKIKLTEDHYLTINLNNELDVARHVQVIIDANRPFLSKLLKQFRFMVDEEEIHSRFYEKLWQAVIQYDDWWGHKFHTFLHRALKNILLDEKTKKEKVPMIVSLNTTINDKNNEELGNVLRDKVHEISGDPINRVHEIRFFEMLKSDFNDDEQQVMFLIMDGFKDREIAVSLNKNLSDVVSIKKNLSSSPKLLSWFYQTTSPYIASKRTAI